MQGWEISEGLAKALRDATRDGGRMWYARGWLWASGPGHVARLQRLRSDFGDVARFDVPKDVLRQVRKGDTAVLTPQALSVHDRDGGCRATAPCEPTRHVYVWEQWAEPGVRDTSGASFVDPRGVALASAVVAEAVGDRRCGYICETVEEAHQTVRALGVGDEWRAEAVAFAGKEAR